jgi:hypothetical protein
MGVSREDRAFVLLTAINESCLELLDKGVNLIKRIT